jgi:ATP-dependent DNA helicase RecQ
MREPKTIVHGFDRPNIHLRVDHYRTEQEKMDAIVHRVGWAEKPGIVYVGTRKAAEDIMGALAEEGVNAVFYHAGLNAKERDSIQQQFMSGDVEVIVATNAFGMGVDKADVRFVYHYDVSESLDAYYQEIGRAGRDGEKAEAILFYRPENIGVQKYRTGSGKVESFQVEKVAGIIAQEDSPVHPDQIAEKTDLSKRKLATVLHRLEDVGAVEPLPNGEVTLAEEVDIAEAAQAVLEEHDKHKDFKRERLEQMQAYAEMSECRREFLLRYFGDEFTGPCMSCDNCEAKETAVAVDSGAGTRREVS